MSIVRRLCAGFHARPVTRFQLAALGEAGCTRVFTETASGAKGARPELAAALDYLRSGDTLVVWKLDRLARSVHQLVDTAADLRRLSIRRSLRTGPRQSCSWTRKLRAGSRASAASLEG